MFSFLGKKKFHGNVSVRGVSIDVSRMHVAAGLKPDLTGRKSAVDTRSAWRVHSNLSIAQHYANRIEVVAVQQNRIVWRNLYLINVYIFVVKGQTVMGFGC